jgi:hypothetical protein
MSTLTNLKTAAAADLAKATGNITGYVAELEAAVKANKALVIGVAVASAMLGAFVGHMATK